MQTTLRIIIQLSIFVYISFLCTILLNPSTSNYFQMIFSYLDSTLNFQNASFLFSFLKICPKICTDFRGWCKYMMHFSIYSKGQWPMSHTYESPQGYTFLDHPITADHVIMWPMSHSFLLLACINNTLIWQLCAQFIII